METRDRRSFIHLVYSSSLDEVSKKNDSEKTAMLQNIEKAWNQLELFSIEKPYVVIIAQPDHIGFEGIRSILDKGHARRIIDLRFVPFISFDEESRESFLEVLKKREVEYLNLFNLKKFIGDVASQADATTEILFNENSVKAYLKPMIENGPTVIFSCKSPSIDAGVKHLLDSLTQASIAFSAVYAESQAG